MKNLNALIRLYALPALIFSFSMICMPFNYNVYADDNLQEIAFTQKFQLKMKLDIPRIYDNNESLGYRKNQKQSIEGTMKLCYDKDGNLIDLQFGQLMNTTHILSNGKNVTYKCYRDESKIMKFVAIGNNKTKKFKTASICFSIAAEPNYNIGEFDEDTSLFITLSCTRGTMKDDKIWYANGYAVGTIGCGCFAYGHVSPTRLLWFYGVSSFVDDIAAVNGTWKMKLIK